jgi:hypothetical protein
MRVYNSSMGDYDRVSRWRAANRKPCPAGCGTEVAWDTIMCRKCTARAKTEKAISRTVAEVKATNKARWTHHVRHFSPKFDSCAVCGYDKHVETAHIKAVASFPDTATIREINAPSNLVGLCPNHHWEFDNGLLEL